VELVGLLANPWEFFPKEAVVKNAPLTFLKLADLLYKKLL